MTRHIPVLPKESVEGLYLKNGDIVVDATLGGGSHAREILSRVLPDGVVIAFDTDLAAIESFQMLAKSDVVLAKALREKSLILVHENYSALGKVLEENHIKQVDAIFADLGFSSDQIESPMRGFSFLLEGPLDMRLNTETSLQASDIINTYSLQEITDILRDYGEESEAYLIAQAIVREREKQLFKTTDQLRNTIERVYPKGKRFKMKVHPATKTFQALRIATNQEFEHLELFLDEGTKVLREGGRIAVITFHSGEDRRVKQFFKKEANACVCPSVFPVCLCNKQSTLRILTKKPIIPTDEEVKGNPRARSAKLRIAQKLLGVSLDTK